MKNKIDDIKAKQTWLKTLRVDESTAAFAQAGLTTRNRMENLYKSRLFCVVKVTQYL